jgi:hypothetical protein
MRPADKGGEVRVEGRGGEGHTSVTLMRLWSVTLVSAPSLNLESMHLSSVTVCVGGVSVCRSASE